MLDTNFNLHGTVRNIGFEQLEHPALCWLSIGTIDHLDCLNSKTLVDNVINYDVSRHPWRIQEIPILKKKWCFHILKIISFMESVVFNHLDDTLTSVFSKIIGSNVRFIVSSSEELIKYPILSFRLELMSIGQIRQFLVLTHFYT